MKKQVFGMVAALFALILALFTGAYAADTSAAELSAANIAYAILYEDGTLVFQNSDTPDGRAVKATYEVDLSAVYTDNSPAPWYNERNSISAVNFTDKISPISTAWWFDGCFNLKRVDNIKKLDTASVTSMWRMFNGCYSLTELDVSYFNTTKVTDMGMMFAGCGELKTLDLSHFDTTNVTDMLEMFKGCYGLETLDLSHFDTANVTNMFGMFWNCSNLQTICVSDKFTTLSVEEIDSYNGSGYMFYNCNALIGGNQTKYDESHIDKEYARIDVADAPGYFTAKDAPAPVVAYAITDAVTGNGKLSVTLTNPGAAMLAVSYFDASGKFVSVNLRDVQANAGTAESSVPANATTARVMLLDDDFRPLCAARPATI
ncbi:MAG: BspA family leucine-rich repeat surface protein [Oscillospiraceae bacterium]|nr:BspA family leucine-rich repeat surface protein [Oscillospiraceae bacterium]